MPSSYAHPALVLPMWVCLLLSKGGSGQKKGYPFQCHGLALVGLPSSGCQHLSRSSSWSHPLNDCYAGALWGVGNKMVVPAAVTLREAAVRNWNQIEGQRSHACISAKGPSWDAGLQHLPKDPVC